MKQFATDRYQAMSGLPQFVDTSSLPHSLMELVKVRASQLNRCAFCLDMYSNDALALGVPLEKLFLLGAWPEATCFSEQECGVRCLGRRLRCGPRAILRA